MKAPHPGPRLAFVNPLQPAIKSRARSGGANTVPLDGAFDATTHAGRLAINVHRLCKVNPIGAAVVNAIVDEMLDEERES